MSKDTFDTKKIYDDLIDRCKQARAWEIRCIVDESFVGVAPFDIIIYDGVFYCKVIAPTLKDAYIEVSNKLPVVKFLDYKNEWKE
jgi:hypothetical protein